MNPLFFLLLIIFAVNYFPLNCKSYIFDDAMHHTSSIRKFHTTFIINGIDSPAPRPFFAKLKLGDSYCGATIINLQFAVTAAHCIFMRTPSSLTLEVGDYNFLNDNKTTYDIEDYFIAPGFQMDQEPINDLALLKTTQVIELGQWIALPMCFERILKKHPQRTTFSSCGLGSTSNKRSVTQFPLILQSCSRRNCLLRKPTKLIVKGINSPSSREFFAKLIVGDYFCGATVINSDFAITAAHCVFTRPAFTLVLEVADYVYVGPRTTSYAIADYFIAPGFIMDDEPINDLALLRVAGPIENGQHFGLPPCFRNTLPNPSLPMVISSCGMGTTSINRTVLSLPIVLKEMMFAETSFDGMSRARPVPCRADNVCTIPAIEGANICYMDDGGPLFIMDCATMEPECLYGVASYYRSDTRQNADHYCNAGSYFTRVVYFQDWILQVILTKVW